MDDVSICKHTANVSLLAAQSNLRRLTARHCYCLTRQVDAESDQLWCLGSTALYGTASMIQRYTY